MASQQIKRFNRFPDIKGLDKELDLIVKQITDLIGVLDPAIGEVYIDDDDPVVITVTTPGTYYLVDSLKTGERNKVEMLSTGMRLQMSGTYVAMVATSFTCDVNNTLVHMAVFYNSVLFKKMQMERKIGTAADFGAMPMGGFGVGKASGLVELKITADKACDVTFNHLNFIIRQVI